jgi:Cof subfamily protein (haloacid dehalogenase superfamily)
MLLAIDLDGTLLTPEKTVTPGTVHALRTAHERGHEVLLISARSPSSMGPYADQIGLDGYVIAYNGAFIVNRRTGRVLLDRPMSVDDTRRIVAIVREHDAYTGYYAGQQWYVEKVCEEMRLEERAQPTPPTIVDDLITQAPDRAHKCIVIDLADDQRLAATYEAICGALPHLNVHYSSNYSFEISDGSASKGAALEFYAGHRGIDPADIIAVGDGHNDMSMLRYAGVGVAMGNAPDEVKAAADRVVAANDADGLIELVEWLLNGRPT